MGSGNEIHVRELLKSGYTLVNTRLESKIHKGAEEFKSVSPDIDYFVIVGKQIFIQKHKTSLRENFENQCVQIVNSVREANEIGEGVIGIRYTKELPYLKLRAFNKIEKLGLHVHDYRACSSLVELVDSVMKFDYMCTIRTDVINAGEEKTGDYPFYKITNPEEFVMGFKKYDSNLKDGYVFIVADGLRHDKDLKCNMVYKLNKDKNFVCEFSRVNVPLKHMYRYPNKLNYISGSLDEGVRNWDRRILDPGIDLRIVEVYLNKMWEIQDLHGKFVEMSMYYGGKEAYWEII